MSVTTTSRRNFLRQMTFAGSERKTSETGQQTLVCVFLRGGADTLNLVVPYGDDQYYRLRPTISIAPPIAGNEDAIGSAAKLNEFYALHPLLRPLLPIYQEGRLGIIQAVGTDNPTGSHFETQDQMEHGEQYGQAIGGGWLGRYLQVRNSSNSDKALTPLSAVAIGQTIPESLRAAPSASALTSLDEVQLQTLHGENTNAVSQALAALYGAEVGLLGESGRETLELLTRVENLRGKPFTPEGGADYKDDNFSKGLREIARLIKAEVGLEIACIDLDGWDTHFFQGTTAGAQAQPIDSLGRGLAAFDQDLIRYRQRVTTLVVTEFGRRSYENSSLGTDHGRGFAALALGGRINGGKIHGAYPGLAQDTSIGPSGLEVLIDYRSVLSELLINVMKAPQINKIFPNFKQQQVGLS
ncbi:MAG: DUF1501 domain-containing protein [Pyrinomonadaceae bacterium]